MLGAQAQAACAVIACMSINCPTVLFSSVGQGAVALATVTYCSIMHCRWCYMIGSDTDLASQLLALIVQDGKYDRLLRLLYDDIQKYETEVTVKLLFAAR